MKKSDEQLLEELKAVLSMVGWDISQNEYDRLEVKKTDRKTLCRRFNKTWDELIAIVSPIDTNQKKQLLILQNKRLSVQLEQERNKTQIILDNCLAEISKVSFKSFPIPKIEKTKENLEFHSLRSDAQVGEKILPDSTQGLGHYDIDTYKKRLSNWIDRILLFKMQDTTSLGLNKLVIHHLGDQVEGEAIYRGQSFYLDASLFQQLFISVEQESSALICLAKVFPEVEVYCVDGNHGRPAGKGDNHGQTNFDRIFYMCLKKWVERQINIKVYVSESPSMLVQHGNFVFSLNHGSAINSWNGIPFYGLERMMRRLPDLYGMIIDYGLYAHFHTPLNIEDKIFVNGCFPGGSDLSINKIGIKSLPSQKIFYFHPKKGINRETNLYLDEPIKLKADKNRIFTAYK